MPAPHAATVDRAERLLGMGVVVVLVVVAVVVGRVMLDRSGVTGVVVGVRIVAHRRVGTSGGILADRSRGCRAS